MHLSDYSWAPPLPPAGMDLFKLAGGCLDITAALDRVERVQACRGLPLSKADRTIIAFKALSLAPATPIADLLVALVAEESFHVLKTSESKSCVAWGACLMRP